MSIRRDDFDRILLEAEIAPSSRSSFEQRYSDITGNRPVIGEHYQVQMDKWGAECRIYFDAPKRVREKLEKLGYHVEYRIGGYRSDYEYRINNNDLFWTLVEKGFRLGPN